MAKRYGTSCAEREGGLFVKASDYEALKAECERLRVDAERWATYMHLFTADAGDEVAQVLVLAIDEDRARERA
ncbi:hypothetical protein [Paraburkholderia dilworthii]|uniref:hypothetical protein n=1 Tax=Paraburkholderia dilworthii TaxID=948106 RepID=UPI00047F91EC|nr:hypothetical protein [Paraburkholderia dilworthii]